MGKKSSAAVPKKRQTVWKDDDDFDTDVKVPVVDKKKTKSDKTKVKPSKTIKKGKKKERVDVEPVEESSDSESGSEQPDVPIQKSKKAKKELKKKKEEKQKKKEKKSARKKVVYYESEDSDDTGSDDDEFASATDDEDSNVQANAVVVKKQKKLKAKPKKKVASDEGQPTSDDASDAVLAPGSEDMEKDTLVSTRDVEKQLSAMGGGSVRTANPGVVDIKDSYEVLKKQCSSRMVPVMKAYFRSLYERCVKEAAGNKESADRRFKFVLVKMQDWGQDKIRSLAKRFVKRHPDVIRFYSFFYAAHLVSMNTFLQRHHETHDIEIEVPKFTEFVYSVVLDAAKFLYGNTEVMHLDMSAVERVKVDGMLDKQCYEKAIIDSVCRLVPLEALVSETDEERAQKDAILNSADLEDVDDLGEYVSSDSEDSESGSDSEEEEEEEEEDEDDDEDDDDEEEDDEEAEEEEEEEEEDEEEEEEESDSESESEDEDK